MNSSAKRMALGGVTAALGVALMCMGTLIPVATYMVPMMLCLFLGFLKPKLGVKYAFCWYLTVAVLGILLAPDKEAAAVFLFLGYYPIIKPWMDKKPLSLLWKLLLFNVTILLMYWLLMHVFGMAAIREEFSELGTIMTIATLVLGNVTFFLMDMLLGGKIRGRRR